MSRHHRRVHWRAWAKLRRFVLERDRYRCRICGLPSKLECDHIVPLEKGGAALDPDNCQAICTPCHIAKTLRENGIVRDPEVLKWRAFIRASI